jgi:hypothetical protein
LQWSETAQSFLLESDPDDVSALLKRVLLACDAQTSGGLLAAVPADTDPSLLPGPIIGRMTAVGCTMEDKGKAPEDSGQAQTGIFARIKSIATQNSFVTSAVTQLTRAERERAEVAEAERDRAIASAARLRYERDETRTIACFFLAAIIFSGSLSQWMTWICTIVAASGAMRLFIDLDIIRSWCKAIPSPGAPGASPSESAGLGSECVMPEEGCE